MMTLLCVCDWYGESINVYAIRPKLFPCQLDLAHQFFVRRWNIVEGEDTPA